MSQQIDSTAWPLRKQAAKHHTDAETKAGSPSPDINRGQMRTTLMFWCGLAAAGLAACGWTVLYIRGYAITHENGWMENQQAFCLLGAATIFACAGHEVLRAARLLYLSLGLFCFTLLFRELELEGDSVPAWATWLGTGTPRNVWLACLWTWLLLTARGDLRETCQVFIGWLRTPAARLMIVAGLFYAMTWPFDKKMFELMRLNMFLEELGDSTAAILVLGSGIITLRQRARVPSPTVARRGEREIAESVR